MDIAQLLLEGNLISRQSNSISKEDNKSKDERILKEEALNKIKAKINAVQDSKNLNIKYSKVLENLQSQVFM